MEKGASSAEVRIKFMIDRMTHAAAISESGSELAGESLKERAVNENKKDGSLA